MKTVSSASKIQSAEIPRSCQLILEEKRTRDFDAEIMTYLVAKPEDSTLIIRKFPG
jgi:hypothetical protein